MPVPDRCLEGLGSARSAVPQFADPRQFADYVRLNRIWQSAIVSARQGERSGSAHMCSVLGAAVLFRYFIRYLWRRLLWPDRCFSSSRRVLFESVAHRCRKIPARLALTTKTFVLIVTFAATTDLIGGARTELIASFDDYQACASAVIGF